MVFILSRANCRVQIAYLACLNWKMCSRVSHALPQSPGCGSRGGVCPARRVGIAADEGSRTTVWKMVGILDRDSLAHCLDGSNGFVERDNCATIHPHVMSGLGDGTATCTCVGSYNDIEICVLDGKGQRLKVSGSYTSEGFPIEKYAGLKSEEKVLPFRP